jgi:hypothetical protein
MRLEHIPLIIGVIVALIGLGFLADAVLADSSQPSTERRRRIRAERSRPGEGVVGVGVLCMAAALLGRDTWRYGTVAVLAGGVLILVGIILNRSFLKETLLFRGPARRAHPDDTPPTARPAARGSGSATKPSSSQAAAAAVPAPQPPATPRPARPALAATQATPVAPMRPTDSSRAGTDAARTGQVERRKTPRGKK